MALPKNYGSPEEYFLEAVTFFKRHQDLFKIANTDILVEDVLNKLNIDTDNLTAIDITEEHFDLHTEDEYIKDIFDNIRKLTKEHNEFARDRDVESNFNVPVGPKKKHEVVYLAKEIENVCKECCVDTVVDFGCGLGYLDQLLYQNTNFKVLGLECNSSHYVGAKTRQRKYHINSIGNVKYIKHSIDAESHVKIEEYLQEKFVKIDRFGIAGLHACADLSVDGINIFLKMADAKALTLMPCCYHKMIRGVKSFKNFPLSNCLKKIYEDNDGFSFINVPFLRLAAQPPKFEENLKNLVFNLLARATLQLYASKHNYKLKRNKRKAVKIKSLENNFDSYIEDAKSGFKVSSNDPNIAENTINLDTKELQELWITVSDEITTKKAVIFIILQNYLQPVLENFILYDRLVYLKENGIDRCFYKKIVDADISPRCLALVAVK